MESNPEDSGRNYLLKFIEKKTAKRKQRFARRVKMKMNEDERYEIYPARERTEWNVWVKQYMSECKEMRERKQFYSSHNSLSSNYISHSQPSENLIEAKTPKLKNKSEDAD